MAETKSRIVNGDCIAGMKKIEPGSIDLVFADPPFNIGYEYDKYDDKRPYDDYLDWSREWIAGVIRVLKPSGTFWLAIGDEYAAELKVMATRELGLTCRNWVVWYYTFGVNCKHKFTRSHTHLFYFVKDAKDFTFNSAYPQSDPRSIRVPSARQLVYGDKRANPNGRLPDDTWIIPSTQTVGERTRAGDPSADREGARAGDPNRERKGAADSAYAVKRTTHQSTDPGAAGVPNAAPRGWILRPQDLPDGFSADSDTWYFPRVCCTFKERMGFHGCQMPEQLLARIIKACSNEGDTVLDPFAGSGTTLTVAQKLGRKPIGFEMSKDYADAVRKRLRTLKPGDPIEGFEDPLYTVPTTADGTIRTASGKRAKRNGVRAPKSVEAGQETLWGDQH